MGECNTNGSKMCVVQSWVRTAALVVLAASAFIYATQPQPPAGEGRRGDGPRARHPQPPAAIDAPAVTQ